MPKTSVVIRTLDEAEHLEELLSSIAAQEVPPDMAVEVVLVDSGSTDDTLAIARRFGCKIIYIQREEFSFGRSLNMGCDAAEGDYLVFVSGHCVPVDNRWLQALCKPLVAGEASYVYGRQIGGADTKFSEKQIFAKYFPSESRVPQEGFYCNNANAAIARSVWRDRRFDEDLTGLEDMHLAKRLVSDGLQIAYTAEACVYHLHDETWPQVRRRFEREALALQRIMPQVHIRQRDLVRYIASSIRMDMRAALAQGVLYDCVSDIVKYRFQQYVGSYLGNRGHQELSHFEKERYFYPDHEGFERRQHGRSKETTGSQRTRAAAGTDR